jgi:hypothetical protein
VNTILLNEKKLKYKVGPVSHCVKAGV